MVRLHYGRAFWLWPEGGNPQDDGSGQGFTLEWGGGGVEGEEENREMEREVRVGGWAGKERDLRFQFPCSCEVSVATPPV